MGFFTRDGPCEYILETGDYLKGDKKGDKNENTTKELLASRPESSQPPIFNLTVGLLESFTVSKEKEKEEAAKKLREQEARRKAAEERQKKKEMRAAKLKEAEKQ